MGEIWNGTHPEDGSEVFVTDDLPVGGKAPDGGHTSATFAPFYDMGNVRIQAGNTDSVKSLHLFLRINCVQHGIRVRSNAL